MALSQAERILLERRLQRLAHRSSTSRSVVVVLALALALPVTLVGAGVLGVGAVYAALAGELEQGLARLQNLEQRASFETSRIRDRNGVVMRELTLEGNKRTPLTLDQIPLYVRQATIAVEDKTFYTNPGVDIVAIARATGRSVLGGGINAGGASTITQQFVRAVAFSYAERIARSPTRKIKEIILSLILTRQYSKDQILDMYLNEIYYGNHAYGIEAAAKAMFGKSAHDLTLAEAALLAGLPQAPGDLDPLNPDPDVQARVAARQATVLDLMAENGYITQAEADTAKAQPMAYAQTTDEGLFLAPHFVTWVEKQLDDIVGPEKMAEGGLDITTTLDLSYHDLAQRIVTEQVEKLRKAHDMNNAALVAIEPRTGQILAMVGSVDFWNKANGGEVNVVVRDRQPGSSIKPITYVTALQNNLNAASMLWDVKMELYIPQKFEPQNYDKHFRGPVRLRAALANSYNIPALKLLASIIPTRPEDSGKSGVELTLDSAHRMGITGLNQPPGHYGLSLTLGGGEVTLLDMATAYGTLANGGKMVRPHAILKITDRDGNVLYDLAKEPKALEPQPATDPAAAYIITDILSDNAARTPAFGANSPLNIGVPAAVKTGTTNDYRDNWTLGFTPYLAVGVWAGNNDNHPMKNTSGVTGAAPIWSTFMKTVINDPKRRAVVRQARSMFGIDTPTTFKRPKNVVEGTVCKLDSLNQLSTTCPETQTELFIEGTQPEKDVWSTFPSVVVPLPPMPDGVDADGQPVRHPTALLCLPGGGFGDDKVADVAALPLPTDAEERQKVLDWSATGGWTALEPVAPCTSDMVAAAMSPTGLLQPGSAGTPGAGLIGRTASYHLNLRPDTTLTASTVLTGTVRFDPGQVEYYKVELGQGRTPSQWMTLGQVHREQAQDAAIETLDAPSLAPGDYIVRLVLVGKDGNFLGRPDSVPVHIKR